MRRLIAAPVGPFVPAPAIGDPRRDNEGRIDGFGKHFHLARLDLGEIEHVGDQDSRCLPAPLILCRSATLLRIGRQARRPRAASRCSR